MRVLPHVEAIVAKGFTVVREAIDHDLIEAARSGFDVDGSGFTEHLALDDDQMASFRWNELARHSLIVAIAESLLGEYEVRSHGRCPLPGGGEQGLHTDLPAGKTTPVDALVAIWMLDDFTEANGATRLVPRSHTSGTAVPRHSAQPDQVHPDQCVVTGSKGDVLVFDAHLWHGGRRNTTSKPRRSIQMTMTRCGLTRDRPLGSQDDRPSEE